MKDNQEISKEYTDWHIKNGGMVTAMTMRDHYAALAMQAMMITGFWNWEKPDEDISRVYAQADAMLKERAK
jgi:hypothetical protein